MSGTVSSRAPHALAALLLLAATSAGAAPPDPPNARLPAPGAPPEPRAAPPPLAEDALGANVTGQPTAHPPRIDGHVDEPAWSTTLPFGRFRQNFPVEGAPPSEPTEVRVLYDAQTLYVAVVCGDRRPGAVQRPEGRRDAPPPSDKVTILLAPAVGGRSAFAFTVTAGGVAEDGVYFEDDHYSRDWDAVWRSAATQRPDGWSAELAIPRALLGARGASWGFAARRTVGRTREEVSTVILPRSGGGVASRLPPLEGVATDAPRGQLELAPYAATRIVSERNEGAPARRATDGIGDLGLDLRWRPSGRLELQGAWNPDFGLVEADELVQNLTTFETFFPEKRPFFASALDLFRPWEKGSTLPFLLFYSRRIGLDAPILAAAKLIAHPSDRLEIGVLDALVDTRFRPLHLSSRRDTGEDLTENFLATSLRWRPAPSVHLFTTGTSVIPGGNADVAGGNALAGGWELRSDDRAWTFQGQVVGSQRVGGPSQRVLTDGTTLRPRDLGLGAYAQAGKVGGEPWRAVARFSWLSPRLELNGAGYQPTQNEQEVALSLQRVRTTGGGAVTSHGTYLDASLSSTTDGRGLLRGRTLALRSELTLHTFHALSCEVGASGAAYDVRMIRGSGIPYRRPGSTYVQCSYARDAGGPLALDAGVGARRDAAAGPLEPAAGANANIGVTLRPGRRMETRLWAGIDRGTYRARWVDADGAGTYTFGDLDAASLSMTGRTTLVLAPRLTLQAYAQLFTELGRWRSFREAQADGRAPLGPGDLRPVGTPDLSYQPQTRGSTLNVNVTLRWEYRPGAVLYAAYARSQSGAVWPADAGAPPLTLAPRLGGGPAVDSVLLKWTFSWSS